MEFSFDRAKNAHLNRTQSTNSSSDPRTNSNSGLKAGPDINSQDPSTIANERLRKAIERNRAKQAERESQRPKVAPVEAAVESQASLFSEQERPPVLPQTPPPFQTQRNQEELATHSRSNYGSFQARPEIKEEIEEVEEESESISEEPISMAQEEVKTESGPARASSSFSSSGSRRARTRSTMNTTGMEDAPNVRTDLVSRRSVAKPENTEFVPVKRTNRKVAAAHVSYTTSSTRKKVASKTQSDSKYLTWLVKGCWMFCGLMVLRLIFADGGVTDFYSQKQTINSKLNELGEIKKENMSLVREIERMRSDSGYQKKLVRDNLGFIAPDEFLILFPREK